MDNFGLPSIYDGDEDVLSNCWGRGEVVDSGCRLHQRPEVL